MSFDITLNSMHSHGLLWGHMTSKNKTASCPNSLRLRKSEVSEGNSALLTPIVDHLLGFTFIDFYAQKFFFPGCIN